MRCLERKIIVGKKARTVANYHYPLPAGLASGVLVDVVSSDGWTHVVTDDSGVEFSVARRNLTRGMLYEIDGAWLPASHPSVLAGMVSQGPHAD